MALYSYVLEEIIPRLVKRFSLSDTPDTDLSRLMFLLKTIQPVTLVDDLLQTFSIEQTTIVSVENSYITAFTVPATERWKVYAIDLYRSTGDRTSDSLYINDPSYTMKIAAYTAAAAYTSGMLAQPIELDRNWLFKVYIKTGGTTDGNWPVSLLVSKSKAYRT